MTIRTERTNRTDRTNIGVLALMGKNGESMGEYVNFEEYGRVWMVVELGNFWQLGKLGQV